MKMQKPNKKSMIIGISTTASLALVVGALVYTKSGEDEVVDSSSDNVYEYDETPINQTPEDTTEDDFYEDNIFEDLNEDIAHAEIEGEIRPWFSLNEQPLTGEQASTGNSHNLVLNSLLNKIRKDPAQSVTSKPQNTASQNNTNQVNRPNNNTNNSTNNGNQNIPVYENEVIQIPDIPINNTKPPTTNNGNTGSNNVNNNNQGNNGNNGNTGGNNIGSNTGNGNTGGNNNGTGNGNGGNNEGSAGNTGGGNNTGNNNNNTGGTAQNSTGNVDFSVDKNTGSSSSNGKFSVYDYVDKSTPIISSSFKQKMFEQLDSFNNRFVIVLPDNESIQTYLSYIIYDYSNKLLIDKLSYGKLSANDSRHILIEVTYLIKGEQIAELDKFAREFANKHKSLTDKQKIEKVNEYIKEHGKYEEKGSNIYSPYELYKNGKGVCQAYTSLAKILLDSMGVENGIAVGSKANIPHTWNVVYLNGEEFHMDITSNDISNSNNFLLLAESQISKYQTLQQIIK